MTGEKEFRRHLVRSVLKLATEDVIGQWQLVHVNEDDDQTHITFQLREPFQWIERPPNGQPYRVQKLGTVTMVLTTTSIEHDAQ